MFIYYEDLVLEAMETVSAWNVPEECFAQAVTDRIQGDLESAAYIDIPVDDPYAPLSF